MPDSSYQACKLIGNSFPQNVNVQVLIQYSLYYTTKRINCQVESIENLLSGLGEIVSRQEVKAGENVRCLCRRYWLLC